MSLRLRLALWYGGLTAVVVLFVSVLTYAEHTSAHYDDLDRALVASAAHVAGAYGADMTTGQVRGLLDTPLAPEAALRLYNHQGKLMVGAPAARSAPTVDPRAVLSHPSVAPFDPVAALVPSILPVNAGSGRFGVAAGTTGTRWRLYAMPLGNSGQYLVAVASLDRIDAAIAGFRRLVLLFTILGGLLTLVVGWLIAGRALRPVAVLTDTAARIARSRHFTQRVPVGRDTDEMGRMAATFNSMLDSLEEAYRLQQRFVADASHELRAPLTAIRGNLELLERQGNMSAQDRQDVVQEANREADRMTLLVAELLSLARADAGLTLRKQPVELDRVLLEALRDARHLAHGQRFDVAALEPTVVPGDLDRLKQLFLILLDNALKYTPDGSITLALRRTERCAEITVQDTGIGISGEDLPHVFERFYRADPARGRDPGGTGLGLAIAWWIVEQHGGEINLKSQRTAGTTVTVRLPAAS